MSKHNNLQTVAEIGRRVARGDRDFGRVFVREEGEYLLLNYTQEALFEGRMSKVEQACRGLVIRSDGKIMALPMPKMYNLGEPDCPPLPDEVYDVWEKIDGSLVNFFHDRQGWRCNTRGVFENVYSQFAQERWDWGSGGREFPRWWTVMCEVVIPDDEMPRAAYTDPGLYLVAVRDNRSGRDLDPQDIDTGMSKAVRCLSASIEVVKEGTKSVEGIEGWVVRFQNGLRVKLKTRWYLRMFRALQDLTPKHVRQIVLDGWEEWIYKFPDDLVPEAMAMKERIVAQLDAELDRIYRAYAQVAGISERKEFALTVLRDYPQIAHWLFNLRDDKFDESNVLKKLNLGEFG